MMRHLSRLSESALERAAVDTSPATTRAIVDELRVLRGTCPACHEPWTTLARNGRRYTFGHLAATAEELPRDRDPTVTSAWCDVYWDDAPTLGATNAANVD